MQTLNYSSVLSQRRAASRPQPSPALLSNISPTALGLHTWLQHPGTHRRRLHFTSPPQSVPGPTGGGIQGRPPRWPPALELWPRLHQMYLLQQRQLLLQILQLQVPQNPGSPLFQIFAKTRELLRAGFSISARAISQSRYVLQALRIDPPTCPKLLCQRWLPQDGQHCWQVFAGLVVPSFLTAFKYLSITSTFSSYRRKDDTLQQARYALFVFSLSVPPQICQATCWQVKLKNDLFLLTAKQQQKPKQPKQNKMAT